MAQRKITNTNRAFNGVWIPKKYWLDENLSPMEVLFMAEIESLDGNNGCFASNNHFADFFGISAGRVSQIITSLKDKGYLAVSYNKNGKQVLNRIIRVVNKLNDGIKNTKDPIKKTKEGYLENAKGSNTSRVIQDSNTDIDKDDDDSVPARKDEQVRDEDPFALASQANINVNSGLHLPIFVEFVQTLGEPVVCWAVRKTADSASHPNWQYLQTVLKNLEANSVRTVEQAEQLSEKHRQEQKLKQQGKPKYGKRAPINEPMPKCFKQQQEQGKQGKLDQGNWMDQLPDESEVPIPDD
ncbi:DnaD domain protein [Limosilactobacillus reuteri]|uniref:DnaD domain protein n=1 Tax=Limosilactobacillus reuteri TaxID=1598 RepID=UPI001CDD5F26|nr:DnaD domain protein [Limosilactobacillus reuteri]MCH5384552.1 DnaD domain protein [Limosilactobacillus reuteri]